jgi:LPS O-antigen subunit length determinant protein (WzzB/FepE family)
MLEKYTDSTNVEDDEIDLYDIFLVLKKRSRFILSVFLITVLAAGIVSFIMTPVYNSSFIIKGPVIFFANNRTAPLISTEEQGKLIDELNNAVKEGMIAHIADLLKISADNAMKIRLLYTKIPKDSWKNYIEIVMEIEDPTIIVSIKDGINGYLNRNEYVSERQNLTRSNLIRRKKEIQKKINEIDEFKNILTAQIKQGKRENLGFNPMVMERDVINLRQELNDIEDKIQLVKGFEIMVEPFIPEKPAKPRKILNIAAAGIISLFFGVLLVFFMEWKEKSRKRVNKTNT